MTSFVAVFARNLPRFFTTVTRRQTYFSTTPLIRLSHSHCSPGTASHSYVIPTLDLMRKLDIYEMTKTLTTRRTGHDGSSSFIVKSDIGIKG